MVVKRFGVLMMVLVVIALFGIVGPASDRNIVYSEELALECTQVESQLFSPEYC